MIRKNITILAFVLILFIVLTAIACISVRHRRWTIALFQSVGDQDISAVQTAIDHGANVNAHRHWVYMPNTLMFNDTPLISACRTGNEQIIDLLIQNGADVNREDNYTKNTPLIQVLHSGAPNRFAVATNLIALGADYLVEQDRRFTVLEGTLVVLPHDDEQTIEEGFILFQYLVENGVSLSAWYGRESVLTYAAHYRNYNVVKYLIDNQYFAVDERDGKQDTALIIAAEAGDSKMVKLLLEYGADKWLTDTENKTALDYAQENGFTELISLLGR